MSPLGQKPFLEETLEHLPVMLDPRPVRVFDRHRGRRAGKAEDVNVRKLAALLPLLDGGQNLVGGAARKRPAVRKFFPKVGWQLAAGARP